MNHSNCKHTVWQHFTSTCCINNAFILALLIEPSHFDIYLPEETRSLREQLMWCG
ncbi:hypothetical protein YERSI8AC_170041 [Enterobacterales bacterium 8AC]|nr:hypothetical protein YERSI8AC_170041 [Enterobacterales bacterium 8AC]